MAINPAAYRGFNPVSNPPNRVRTHSSQLPTLDRLLYALYRLPAYRRIEPKKILVPTIPSIPKSKCSPQKIKQSV